jgi:hypothetical protein
MYLNTTGTNNTATGKSALRNNTAGARNTANDFARRVPARPVVATYRSSDSDPKERFVHARPIDRDDATASRAERTVREAVRVFHRSRCGS